MKFPIMRCSLMYSCISIAQNCTYRSTIYSIDLYNEQTLTDPTFSTKELGNTTKTTTKEKYAFSHLCNGTTHITNVTINGNKQ